MERLETIATDVARILSETQLGSRTWRELALRQDRELRAVAAVVSGWREGYPSGVVVHGNDTIGDLLDDLERVLP
jgi:hypothetical protein